MLLDLARRVRVALPHGSPLPEAAWRLRHRVILRVLALHAVGVFCFGVVQGFGVPHSLTEAAPLAESLGDRTRLAQVLVRMAQAYWVRKAARELREPGDSRF